MPERTQQPDAAALVAQILGEAPIAIQVAPVAPAVAQPRLPQVTLHGERVRIQMAYNESALPGLRALPGRRYVGGDINEADLAAEVLEFAARWDLVVAPEVEVALADAAEALRVKREAEAILTAASVASEVPEEVAARIALSQYLYDFQVAGAAYALNALRTWIADQMGLGKTRQAKAVTTTMQAFPTLWICKASLKSNIYAELTGHLLDGRVALKQDGTPQDVLTTGKVVVLDGTTPTAIEPGVEDVIVNYDIIAAWKDELLAYGFAAVIVDESHYIKNPKAQRTVAATEIIADVRERMGEMAVVLFLTGTPLPNRTAELIHQLRLLGRLEEIAPRPRRASGPNGTFTDRDWEFSFKFRYCDPVETDHGWKFEGASNTDELNAKLRATCMVRRLRTEVTGLKDTLRQQVWLALNGDLATYRVAEADLAAFLESVGENPTTDERAEALRKVTVLKRLVGEAKIKKAIDWVADFLEQNPDDKVIVFAHHVKVQKALARHFDSPVIEAGMKSAALDEAKRQFNHGDARVIVVSMEAGKEGHNLTAAKNVVFVEQGWTPGGMEQAEDRANRIGQREDVTVTAWYLMADNTIDLDIHALVEEKRRNIAAVIDGVRPSEESIEAEVRDALLVRLADRNRAVAA